MPDAQVQEPHDAAFLQSFTNTHLFGSSLPEGRMVYASDAGAVDAVRSEGRHLSRY